MNKEYKKIAKINVLFIIDSQIIDMHSEGTFHLIEHYFINSIEKMYKLKYSFIFTNGYTVYDHIYITFYIESKIENVEYLTNVIKKGIVTEFDNISILKEQKTNIVNEINRERNIEQSIMINNFLSNGHINYLPIGNERILDIDLKSLNNAYKKIRKNVIIYLFYNIEDGGYKIVGELKNKQDILITEKFNKENYDISYITLDDNNITFALYNHLYYTSYNQVILEYLIEQFFLDSLKNFFVDLKFEISKPSIKCLINSCYTIFNIRTDKCNAINEIMLFKFSKINANKVFDKLQLLKDTLSFTEYNVDFIEENIKRNILYGYPLIFNKYEKESLKKNVNLLINNESHLIDFYSLINNIKIKNIKME